MGKDALSLKIQRHSYFSKLPGGFGGTGPTCARASVAKAHLRQGTSVDNG